MLEPIYKKLKEEQALHSLPHGAPTKTVKQVKAEIFKIKREAWKAAEQENTPSSEKLDQELFTQISKT